MNKHIIPVKEEVPDDDVPDVKVEPPADDDGINGEDEKTHLEGKGAKRKRAPPTKGPCEHGVKYRSNCKVCSACPHGRRRYQCKECGGSAICEHGRMRSHARSAVGHQSASTVVSALSARSAVGLQSASTVVSAIHARSAVGHKSASTVVGALDARSAVGASICEHGRRALSVQGVRWVRNLRARSSAL